MKKTVYIETSVPSFYYETRTDVKTIAWQNLTKLWWKQYRQYYQLVCSDLVCVELQEGKHPNQKRKISLIKDIEYLDHLPIIDDIVMTYIKNKLLPNEAGGDAYHLAYASYYSIDFLLTWNCNHLANPNKFKHMSVINAGMHLETPILSAPGQLLTNYTESGI